MPFVIARHRVTLVHTEGDTVMESVHRTGVSRRVARVVSRFAVLVVVLLLATAAFATSAQDATPATGGSPANLEIVAAGLTNPRGFTWSEDGTLYLALAGTGGPNLPTEGAPVIEAFNGFFGGPSASVVRIKGGCPVTVADGLPSYMDGTGAVAGVSDVAILADQLYATVDGGGVVHANPDQPAGLYRINLDGTFEIVADLSAWMRANRVAEPPPSDNDPDGEVWQMLPAADGSGFWVVESNQGQVLQVTLTGEITRLADLSAGHPVPTGIAPAPDGGVYVGTLTAFPYQDQMAKVVHISPDGTVTDYWTGVTAVVDLAVDTEGNLYALEMVTGSIGEDPYILPNTGRVVRYAGPKALEIVADGLNFPIHMEFGRDGALYVASPAFGGTPGTASIARLDLNGATANGTGATPAAGQRCFVAPSA